MSDSPTAPRWMRRILLVAGIYNIAWGAFAVLCPNTIFGWLGMPAPNYPQLWQCIGMIVGVYGLGYAIAASDPARHWPIVLVGLLGKVFGPLGMVQALWTGALPWGFALNCLTNDVIWWIPFVLILRYAWAQHRSEPGAEPLPDEATLLREATANTGESLAELSERSEILVVFLRHAGCSFCREALCDLAEQRASLERRGIKLVLVHLSPVDDFAAFASYYGLGDVPAVSDRRRRLYRGLGLRRGTLGQLFGGSTLFRRLGACLKGHTFGFPAGDSTQMPGVFLVRHGRVVRRFHHVSVADRPDYVELCGLPAA